MFTVVAFAASVFLGWAFWRNLQHGNAQFGRYIWADRKSEPAAFWFRQTTIAALCVVALAAGLRSLLDKS